MAQSIPPQRLLLLVVLIALLTACDTVLEMGVVPTSTPVPTPTFTPTPSPALETYTNEAYGFTFDYLATWALSEEPHAVRLNRDTLHLYIGYRWATESASIGGRTGAPAGDFIYADKIAFLGQVIPAHILEYQRKDKAVFYGEGGLVEAGDLVFVLYLDDLGARYDELDIPKEVQAEVKGILESFQRVEATGQAPTPPPKTPAIGAVKAIDISYVDEGADLGLLIALRDTRNQTAATPEMAALPAPALAEFEQILNSLESK